LAQAPRAAAASGGCRHSRQCEGAPPMSPISGSSASIPDILGVWRWSATVLHSRLQRWWVGDASLPFLCNACSYLFQPSRLPTPFHQAERYLPARCNCTGLVGCKFPRGGPKNGKLEFCRVPVESGRSYQE